MHLAFCTNTTSSAKFSVRCLGNVAGGVANEGKLGDFPTAS